MITAKTRLFTTILVPVDGSEQSSVALPIAFDMAKLCDAALVICSAYDLPNIQMENALAGYPDTSHLDHLREACEAVAASALKLAEGAGLSKVSTVVSERGAVEAIIGVAKDCDADLIVMGSHGRSGIERMFLGSTTEGVMRRSPVPVLVVRWPTPKTKAQEVHLLHAVRDPGYDLAKALP